MTKAQSEKVSIVVDITNVHLTYPDGIKLDYVMATASVPINYDYAKVFDVSKVDRQSNSSSEIHYFWDGGTLSNTPLRELIQ
jgi:predicted acylesterase/phospholipase RssA